MIIYAYICLRDAFLELKIAKNGYCRNGVLFFAWDLGVILLSIPNFRISRFRFFFFLIQIFRYHRKMCRLFPCIPIFRGVFLLKVQKECVYVIMLKIKLVLVKNMFFGLKKGISELSRWVAQKHTAIER